MEHKYYLLSAKKVEGVLFLLGSIVNLEVILGARTPELLGLLLNFQRARHPRFHMSV